MGLLRIEWVKSAIGYPRDQRAALRALGLRRRGASVVHKDSPSLRGAIRKVQHLVRVEEINETA
jgi:large subunit ribosomal protein L30